MKFAAKHENAKAVQAHDNRPQSKDFQWFRCRVPDATTVVPRDDERAALAAIALGSRAPLILQVRRELVRAGSSSTKELQMVAN